MTKTGNIFKGNPMWLAWTASPTNAKVKRRHRTQWTVYCF